MDKQDHKADCKIDKLFCRECWTELSIEASFCGECGTKTKHRQSPSKPSSTVEKKEKQETKRRFWLLFPMVMSVAVVGYGLLMFILTDKLPITAISFSTDNNRLMSVGEDGYLQSWDVNSGRSIVSGN